MWSVVVFPDECSVAGVPSSWVKVDSSDEGSWVFWPPTKNKTNLDDLIKNLRPPQATWNFLRCIVKQENIKTMKELKEATKIAENLTTTEAEISEISDGSPVSESSASDSLPEPPTKKSKPSDACECN